MAHRAEPGAHVRERAAPMAVRRDATVTAAWKPAVASRPLSRNRTVHVAPLTPQRQTVPRTILGWDAATSRERQRRLILAGIVAATVAALVLTGFVGGFGRGTVVDADGRMPGGITRAGAAAGSDDVSVATAGSAATAASPADAGLTPRATHLASSAGGVRPVAQPSATGSGAPAAGAAETAALAPGSVPLGRATIDYDPGPQNGDGGDGSIPPPHPHGPGVK